MNFAMREQAGGRDGSSVECQGHGNRPMSLADNGAACRQCSSFLWTYSAACHCHFRRPCCSPAEFEELVQRNLGANAGLDYAGFGAMLRCVATASLLELEATAATPALPNNDSNLQQRHQQQQDGVAAADSPAAAAMQPAADTDGGPAVPSGRWYHAFRLLRAALVLQQLLAEQRRIDLACKQEWLKRQQQPGKQRGVVAAGTVPGPGSVGGNMEGGPCNEELPYATEVVRNAACLAAVEQQLESMGIPLPASALHDAH